MAYDPYALVAHAASGGAAYDPKAKPTTKPKPKPKPGPSAAVVKRVQAKQQARQTLVTRVKAKQRAALHLKNHPAASTPAAASGGSSTSAASAGGIPADILNAALAEGRAKYGPEFDALDALKTQALNTYAQTANNARVGAKYVAAAARQSQSDLSQALAAIGAQPPKPGTPPPDATGEGDLARHQLQMTKEQGVTELADAPVRAVEGSNYQVANARHVLGQTRDQINQQGLSLTGQQGDYVGSQIASMLSANAASEAKVKAATTAWEHQWKLANLSQTGQNQRQDKSLAQSDKSLTQSGTQWSDTVTKYGVTNGEIAKMSHDERVQMVRDWEKRNKGSGSGSGSAKKSQFLTPDAQATAQKKIDATIQQILSLSGGNVTRGMAAQSLLKGSPAVSESRYPKTYSAIPGSTVDEAGYVHKPNGDFAYSQIPGGGLSGGTNNARIRLKPTVTKGDKIAAVDPVYVWAALDRLRFKGYRAKTVKALHDAGIKALHWPTVPDPADFTPGQEQVAQHGGTN